MRLFTPYRALLGTLAALPLLLPTPVLAEIYKCVDLDARVSYRSSPCPELDLLDRIIGNNGINEIEAPVTPAAPDASATPPIVALPVGPVPGASSGIPTEPLDVRIPAPVPAAALPLQPDASGTPFTYAPPTIGQPTHTGPQRRGQGAARSPHGGADT